MKIYQLIIAAFASIYSTVLASSVRDMAINNPEQIEQILTQSSYSDLLSFVNDAYQESQSESDGIAQYVYMAALASAAEDKQVGLAIDFSLSKSDMHLKAAGASAITIAVLNGVVINPTQLTQVKNKLKSELEALAAAGSSQEMYNFAQKAATALIVLKDDAGLDVFLTDSKMVRNYTLKDQWNMLSPPELFVQLKNSYAQQAVSSGKEWDKIMSAKTIPTIAGAMPREIRTHERASCYSRSARGQNGFGLSTRRINGRTHQYHRCCHQPASRYGGSFTVTPLMKMAQIRDLRAMWKNCLTEGHRCGNKAS